MNTGNHINYLPRAVVCICLLTLLYGCNTSPPEDSIRDAIISHYTLKHYEVLVLEVGNIEREPLGARQYMGPKRYIVHIPQITLKEIKPLPDSGTGTAIEPMTFKNASIVIRRNYAVQQGWSIDETKGIPLL